MLSDRNAKFMVAVQGVEIANDPVIRVKEHEQSQLSCECFLEERPKSVSGLAGKDYIHH